jgi:hypothetical protein
MLENAGMKALILHALPSDLYHVPKFFIDR